MAGASQNKSSMVLSGLSAREFLDWCLGQQTMEDNLESLQTDLLEEPARASPAQADDDSQENMTGSANIPEISGTSKEASMRNSEELGNVTSAAEPSELPPETSPGTSSKEEKLLTRPCVTQPDESTDLENEKKHFVEPVQSCDRGDNSDEGRDNSDEGSDKSECEAEDITSIRADDRVCSICLEQVILLSDSRKLICGHIFCMDCLRRAVRLYGSHCVTCRADIQTELEDLEVVCQNSELKHDDETVYSITTHRCPVHSSEVMTLSCRNCLSLFCGECINTNPSCAFGLRSGPHHFGPPSSIRKHFEERLDVFKMTLHRLNIKLEDISKLTLQIQEQLTENVRNILNELPQAIGPAEFKKKVIKITEVYLNKKIPERTDTLMKGIQDLINYTQSYIQKANCLLSDLCVNEYRFEMNNLEREIRELLETKIVIYGHILYIKPVSALEQSQLPEIVSETGDTFRVKYDDKFKLNLYLHEPNEEIYEFGLHETEHQTFYEGASTVLLNQRTFNCRTGMEILSSFSGGQSADKAVLVKPYCLRFSYTTLLFSYPIKNLCEDKKYIYVLTSHDPRGYWYEINTLYRVEKSSMRMLFSGDIDVVFRTDQKLDSMLMKGNYMYFAGDHNRIWKVRKNFKNAQPDLVLHDKPNRNPQFGIQRVKGEEKQVMTSELKGESNNED